MATNPTLLTMPIAENGQKNTIPATQAAAGDGLLSQSTGFPPETALPLGAGGKAPTREDFNGAFNLLSDIAFYAQKGWTFQYDATQDYFKGCLVIDPYDGLRYECINDMDAGTVSPHEDTDNDYWKVFSTGGGVPVGFIMQYAGTVLAEGFLDCDGSAVSRTMYPDLFDAIGTTWGAGDGSTTFNLPNLIDAAILNGSYTKTTFTTAGSATFTAPKSGFYKITVKGGGGGGEGGGKSSSTAYPGCGGGEGGTTIGFEHLTAGDTVSVIVGAGGTGGAASSSGRGSDGTNGGDTTATANNNSYIGGGGYGGSVQRSGGGTGTIQGATGGISTSISYSGNTSLRGAAGGGNGGDGFINSAVQGGGGAGGIGATGTSSPSSGGNGGDGYVWIEYFGVTTKFLIKAFDGQTADSALIDITQYAKDLANRLTREQTPAFNHRDVITTSGTYTAPVTGWYRITAKGGGGGGRAGVQTSTTNFSGGSSGGEGGTTIGYEHMAVGDTATVVIGAGGIGGATGGENGANGGNTTVTIDNSAYTGGGGQGGQTYGGGQGGSGTVVGAPGECKTHRGVAGVVSDGASGGGNGGAVGMWNSSTTPPDAGVNGGGGAGGGAYPAGNILQKGGNGGDGYVWFEYFDPSLM